MWLMNKRNINFDYRTGEAFNDPYNIKIFVRQVNNIKLIPKITFNKNKSKHEFSIKVKY